MGRMSLFIIVFGVLFALCMFLIVNCNMFEDIAMKGDILDLTTEAPQWDYIGSGGDFRPDSPGGDHLFGYSTYISQSGSFMIIGAPGENNGQGAAYIYARSGSSWGSSYRIVSDTPENSTYFGYSVAISNDYAVIGVKYDDGGRGELEIFKKNGTIWQHLRTITDIAPYSTSNYLDANANLGHSVAISGNYIIAGAPQDGTNRGKVFILEKDYSGVEVWDIRWVITDAAGSNSARFGNSVFICNDYAIVGAFNDSAVNSFAGAAVILEHVGANWVQEKITSDDEGALEYFGESVSIYNFNNNTYAVIGCPGLNQVYVFETDGATWDKSQILTYGGAAAGDRLGCAVSVFNDNILAGADQATIDSGYAVFYVYDSDNNMWSFNNDIIMAGLSSDALFGSSVAFSNTLAVIGARENDYNVSDDTGSSFICIKK